MASRKLKSDMQKSMKNLTQEETAEMLGYCLTRIAELEVLFDTLIKNKIISKKDLESSDKKMEKNMNAFLKKLNSRKKLEL